MVLTYTPPKIKERERRKPSLECTPMDTLVSFSIDREVCGHSNAIGSHFTTMSGAGLKMKQIIWWVEQKEGKTWGLVYTIGPLETACRHPTDRLCEFIECLSH